MPISPIRQFLSKTKTILYRRPADEWNRLRRWGARGYFYTSSFQREMESSVASLEPIDDLSDRMPVEIWFLTGKNFWYQTAYCAWSFARQSQRNVTVNLVDDGSLRGVQIQQIRRLFPNGVTVQKEDTHAKLERSLPETHFPYLRKKWNDYINIRKIIDIHLESHGRKLVLDSDMLFFAPPVEILSWLEQSVSLCLATDCIESYGYSRSLMESLCQAMIPPRLNVGVCGLDSELIDWNELERWTQVLIEREKNSYYLEQALIAMLAAKYGCVVMPPSRYITCPTNEQIKTSTGVLQHYVSDSKPNYFSTAWKNARKIATPSYSCKDIQVSDS